jgi:hypothetical protein
MVLAVRVALTLATLSTSCLFWLGYASKGLEQKKAKETKAVFFVRFVSFC